MNTDITPKVGELFGADIPDVAIPKRRGRRPKVKEWENRPPLTKEKMRTLLHGLKEIESSTGIKYVELRITHKMIIGVRQSSGKEFTINTDQLYDAYTRCLQFTSPEVKKIIFMGHSPAVAILRWLKTEQNKHAETEESLEADSKKYRRMP